MPDRMNIQEPVKAYAFDETKYDQVLELLMNREANERTLRAGYKYQGGDLLLEKGKRNKVEYIIKWYKGVRKTYNLVTFSVQVSYLKKGSSISEFVAGCEAILQLFNPVKARIYNSSYPEWMQLYDFTRMHPELVWKEYFGKPYVDLFGRDALLSTPCVRAEELSGGLISLQLTEDPLKEVPYEARFAVKQHL